MEMVLVNRKDVPIKKNWFNQLRELAKKFDGKNANTIRVTLKPGEKTNGVETAWRRLCKNEFKKVAHIRIYTHELGRTLWLWMDS